MIAYHLFYNSSCYWRDPPGFFLHLDNLPSSFMAIESASQCINWSSYAGSWQNHGRNSVAGEVATYQFIDKFTVWKRLWRLLHINSLTSSQYGNDCGGCAHWDGWEQTDVPFQLAVEYTCSNASHFRNIHSWKNNIEVVKENNSTNHMLNLNK